MPLPLPPPPPPATDGKCTLFRCFCCWRRVCSPRIPRVAPGRDYVCIPAGADDRPAWSLLVGLLADSGLRLHRFRVAPSGRILGRSNEVLDIFHNVDSDSGTPIRSPDATLSPDGRSLCIFSERPVCDESPVVPTRALKLQLDDDDKRATPLPTVVLGRLMRCRPVTAAGDLWAPCFHLRPRSPCRLVMQRLDRNNGGGDGRWVEAGSIEFPYEMEIPMKWGGSIFQGHAVVHDTVLVSLRPAHIFFSFNCSTCAWTAITTYTDISTSSSSKNTSVGNTTSSKNTSIGTRSEKTSTGNTTTPLDMAACSRSNPNSKNISTDSTTSSINTSTGNTTTPLDTAVCSRSNPNSKNISTDSTASSINTSSGNTTSGKKKRRKKKKTSTGNNTSGKGTSTGNTTSGKDTSGDNTASGKGTSSGNTASGNTISGNDTSSVNTTSGKDTFSGNTILSLGTTSLGKYVPIRGRGVYVEEDGAIYFLQNSTIFAYKLHGRGQGQQPLMELKPPTKIDYVCPFLPDGVGLLTHLGGRVMCSVWISTLRYCSCDYYHVIISTFRVKYCSDDIANGIEILHSTCRQLDMLPCKPAIPIREFCFLQEYEEYNQTPSMLLEGIQDPTSSYVEDSSKMLACCRKFLSKPPFPRCYVLQKPAFQITADMYVVCQDGSRLIVYVTEIVAGRLPPNCNYKPLRLHQDTNTVIRDDSDCHVMKQRSRRYFNIVRSLTSLYAVSYKPDDDSRAIELGRPSSSLLETSRPAGVCFAVVLNVGHRIVAVSHALEVFWFVPPRSRFYRPTDSWMHCRTRLPELDVNRRVDLSGYVVLDADTFIVSDKETCRCFLLDFKVKQWKDVLPGVKSRTLPFLRDPLVYGSQRFNGRSIYLDGYIYSCTDWGIVAYDFHDGLLDDTFDLPFPWRKAAWEGERMCLDLVGMVNGAVLFCVVQAGGSFSHPGRQDVHITIVQVRTARTPVGKFRPVSIDHVDIATCFIPRKDWEFSTSTRSCYSVKR